MEFKNGLIKTAYHRDDGGRDAPAIHPVAYIHYDDLIVFTAVNKAPQIMYGSTLYFAQQIVHTIVEVEQINPRRVTFCDLQTPTGYDDNLTIGSYRCDQLLIDWRKGSLLPLRISWTEANPSSKILHDFAEFIWVKTPAGIPRKVSRREPVRHGRHYYVTAH